MNILWSILELCTMKYKYTVVWDYLHPFYLVSHIISKYVIHNQFIVILCMSQLKQYCDNIDNGNGLILNLGQSHPQILWGPVVYTHNLPQGN